MSERAQALKDVISDEVLILADNWASWEKSQLAQDIARAICEHLGVTWATVEAINEFCDTTNADRDELMWAAHDGISALLEAAGIER